MTPELVYVPTVFIHDDVTEQRVHLSSSEEIIEHVDITTTALAALGLEDEISTMGHDLLNSDRSRSEGISTVHLERNGSTFYQADSVWDYHGGYSLSRSSRLRNLLFFAYQLANGTSKHFLRYDITEAIKNYILPDSTFGEPRFDRQRAVEVIKNVYGSIDRVDGKDAEISEDVEKRLQELGYRPD
jgi:arylsulfatase A-like enzyme